MSIPDKSQKMLLDHDEEFAEVFSAFALKNRIHLDPGKLREAASEYEFIENGNPEELRRDVVKLYAGYTLGLVVCGLENQTSVDIRMPVRMMGYDFARYNWQLNHAESLNQKTRIAPVISHVLNYSYKQKWNWPHALKDLVNLPSELAVFFQDYKIEVTNLAWLTPEQRASLSGDFKVFVEALCEMRETGKITGIAQPVKYINEMLALLSALTGDPSLKDFDISQFKSGETTMCEIWEKWVNQIRSESFENGKEIGFENGKEIGFENGKEIGFENGKEIGFENGEKTGQKSAAISACKDFGKTQEETTAYIIEKLHLTREQAQEAIQTYW